MKGLISQARVFGVYPVSSQEPLKVCMLEKEGTPLTCSVTMDLKRQKSRSRSSLFRIKCTKRATKFFKENLGSISYISKCI